MKKVIENRWFVVSKSNNEILGHYDIKTAIPKLFENIKSDYGLTENEIYIVKGTVIGESK